MGSLIVFGAIVVGMGVIIAGWTMVLRIQRERKISEFKVNLMRLYISEQTAYNRYLQAERAVQSVEMDAQKSKEQVVALKVRVRQRRSRTRELIEELKLVKVRVGLVTGGDKLDLELSRSNLENEIKTLLALNNQDKQRINDEKRRVDESLLMLPQMTEESAELSTRWENLREQVDQFESDFSKLDEYAFRKFADQFAANRDQEDKHDPEREIVNMILLLNNKKGLLYVRRKEMAKEPTTESQKLVNKYEQDILKLEKQLIRKSKSLGVQPERVNALQKMFSK
ncbi:MAG: hypothetical protein FVQ81_00280 [Candidatus Glassbacteria bacterium]|nr:hypothetical protein [Candidatus Glassbacteria bacterium]